MIKLNELAQSKTLIYGAGREAVSVVQALKKVNPNAAIRVIDDSDAADISDVRVEPTNEEAIDWADVIVKSPGISKYKPVFKNARYTTATNLFLAEPHNFVIGVTGTKGKSTTSALVAHLINSLGKKVKLGGNIGKPPLDYFGEDEPDYWVLELSSFQSADLEGHIDVAGFTTFSPEHLDWHGSPDQYFADKTRLFEHASETVVNRFEDNLADLVNKIPKSKLSQELVPIGSPMSLVGKHNWQLACLALSICASAGLEVNDNKELLFESLKNFTPLPHRLEQVAVVGGVTYINDSLSTTLKSAIAAIESFSDRPTTILLGGYDRGIDYSGLTSVLEKHRNVSVITMPDCGIRIAKCVPDATPLEHAIDLADAVKKAALRTPIGGVVVMSPAAASFGHFRDYAHRGEKFREIVTDLERSNYSDFNGPN